MKHKLFLFLNLLVFGSILSQAQQLTQHFSFSTADVKTELTDSFDLINLKGCGILEGKEYIGLPQLPQKNFRLLLPKNAFATKK